MGSCIKRLKNRTRAKELRRLVAVDSRLNEKWLEEFQVVFSGQESVSASPDKALLTIDTHMKKQNSRSFFLVVYGALIAATFKLIGIDLSILLVFLGFLLAGERLIVNETIGALEELKLMVEHIKNT
ncbi:MULTISPECIES: hypothetical protein [Halomonadaceae]|uniref:hypothetical protein n=1 Tax=Halomonadaceae TaxID=28256 RepID=UPI0015820E7D|nr:MULTISPECIES: hypothetical protein [Halomonas]MDI4637518.1 hypothetical protein [Halomonas sp. BMC7]NUJ61351.1 hypothetical protein [Halomonas taeanensis]